MNKADGAFLTIGELAQQLGVAQHILRYWESRFPQLRPLQRAGNRRYYRPQDVDVAQRIHRLLNVEGFTIKGAAKMLSARGGGAEPAIVAEPPSTQSAERPSAVLTVAPATPVSQGRADDGLIDRLRTIRGALSDALGDMGGQPS